MSALSRTAAVLSVAGLMISGYLAYEHATGSATLACSGTGTVDCLKVTTSTYSQFLGIPVAYLGLGFFSFLCVLAAAEATPTLASVRGQWMARRPAEVRAAATALGVAFVAYLIWAEIQVGAICLWCTAVHVITFTLFVISVYALALGEPRISGEDHS